MSDTPPKRLIILAQYDPDSGLPAHVRIHLEALRPCAARLVLVSNSPLSPVARARAATICDSVQERANVGYDFAAWRDVLAQEDMAAWDTVILTNSSIVGPLYPIGPIIEEMESRDVDFWGLVHSKEKASHLQSYFLAFGTGILLSKAWSRFWSQVRDLSTKEEVIDRYEIGLTRHFRDAGFRFEAYMKNPVFPRSIRIIDVEVLGIPIYLPWDINHVGRTIREHRGMVEEGFPYLKASLLWGREKRRLKGIGSVSNIRGTKYPWAELRVQ